MAQVERSLSGEAQMKEDEAALQRLEVVRMAQDDTNKNGSKWTLNHGIDMVIRLYNCVIMHHKAISEYI